MKVELTIRKTFDVKKIVCKAKIRYWEDAKVNGIRENNDTPRIPCKKGQEWSPIIDVENGVILNWAKGVEASVYYKVCDNGVYALLDEKDNEIVVIGGYVPRIMAPKEPGYGDYIIMDIDCNGKIDKWVPDFSEFAC